VIVLLAVAWFTFDRYQRGAPRRSAVSALAGLHSALAGRDTASALSQVEIPAAIAGKPPTEQQRWLGEMLQDEISAEGLAALTRQGRFGPVAELFPGEARRWADTARVPVEECVAFRMERDGLRAEVVLHRTPAGYRIVRCNNVKQMAPPALTKS
jgi:hypothetical protein